MSEALALLSVFTFLLGVAVGGTIESLRAQRQIRKTGKYRP